MAPAPKPKPCKFSQIGTNLSFNPATDLAFSDALIPPANFAACTYSPQAGYDQNITHICLKPQGTLEEGSLSAASFSLSFRVQVQ